MMYFDPSTNPWCRRRAVLDKRRVSNRGCITFDVCPTVYSSGAFLWSIIAVTGYRRRSRTCTRGSRRSRRPPHPTTPRSTTTWATASRSSMSTTTAGTCPRAYLPDLRLLSWTTIPRLLLHRRRPPILCPRRRLHPRLVFSTEYRSERWHLPPRPPLCHLALKIPRVLSRFLLKKNLWITTVRLKAEIISLMRSRCRGPNLHLVCTKITSPPRNLWTWWASSVPQCLRAWRRVPLTRSPKTRSMYSVQGFLTRILIGLE